MLTPALQSALDEAIKSGIQKEAILELLAMQIVKKWDMCPEALESFKDCEEYIAAK